MNEYEATIQINPTDDIKFILEESGCYESEIEMMKAGGTYDAFVKRVYDAIDWSHLSERIAQMENEAITAAPSPGWEPLYTSWPFWPGNAR